MRIMKLRAKATHRDMVTEGKVYEATPRRPGWWHLIGDNGQPVHISEDWSDYFDEVKLPVKVELFPIINGIIAEPEWKLLRNALTAPGNCACGCPRQQCDYHRDVTA